MCSSLDKRGEGKVDNAQAAYEELTGQGIAFARGPNFVQATGRTVVNFRDPDLRRCLDGMLGTVPRAGEGDASEPDAVWVDQS